VQAVEAAKALSDGGEPELENIVALHVGTAFYGNIGAADRLDFTVIGPAVNLGSRKSLQAACASGRTLRPVLAFQQGRLRLTRTRLSHGQARHALWSS
jgi:class 3 adenylate cyclase